MVGRTGRRVREVFIKRKQRNEQEGQLEYRNQKGKKIKAAGESERLSQEDELEA